MRIANPVGKVMRCDASSAGASGRVVNEPGDVGVDIEFGSVGTGNVAVEFKSVGVGTDTVGMVVGLA